MAAKGRVHGYGSAYDGQYAWKNVFKVAFSRPLSSTVKYECYDNNQPTYPNIDNGTTTVNTVFGVYGTSLSMIALRDTTNGTTGPVSGTTWFPSSANANTATTNVMDGTTNYVTQHGSNVVAGGSIYWNMQVKIPATVQTTDTMGFDLLLRYTFTSTTPTLTWMYNATFSETSPVWATIIVDTKHGVMHTRAATATAGPWLANIPSSGVELTQQAWITTTTS